MRAGGRRLPRLFHPGRRAAAALAGIRSAAHSSSRLLLDARLLGMEQLRLLLGPWSVGRAASGWAIVDPGLLGFLGGVYAFRPGYWGQRVGFYGGIDYGFGYSGAGYQGGRWDNGRFFYNTTVNNIAGAHITNVYNQPITNNTTINRASFNGGAGGVVAKPTNEELLAEGATCPAHETASRSSARRRHERRTIRVHESWQAHDRRDRAARRI
jgi:hypothetical protein